MGIHVNLRSVQEARTERMGAFCEYEKPYGFVFGMPCLLGPSFPGKIWTLHNQV